AADAGAEYTEQMINATEEVRTWLSTEGGMAMTRPDKTDFITAAQGVQQEFAEKRGAEFVELVSAIQAAAN
ncbi:MAG: C4-dicarboxylate ABC transporter substrate-binding protein, partial [Pseudomonadota bacterium]